MSAHLAWLKNPCGLVSLWELVKKVFCASYISAGSGLRHQVDLCREIGSVPLPAIGERLTFSGQVLDRNILAGNVKTVELFCEDMSLDDSRVVAFDLHFMLQHNPTPHTFSEIAVHFENLLESVRREASKRLYREIPQGLSGYLDQEKPFGDEVYNAFPSARTDLSQAGNCLAYGCNAATGFHLMRAVEIGLWELGRDRQIPLAPGDRIEFSEWGKIIRELEDAVKKIQQWPNSRTKEEAHKFYNVALQEIRAFNDGWRRHLAHSRPYQPTIHEDEALALWGHVKRFFSILATKIGEGKYTPLIWETT